MAFTQIKGFLVSTDYIFLSLCIFNVKADLSVFFNIGYGHRCSEPVLIYPSTSRLQHCILSMPPNQPM